MPVAARNARLNTAVVSATVGFGEAVTLPSGQAFAVVDLEGTAVELRAQGTRQQGGLDLRHQAPPVLFLREEDAEGLLEHAEVTVRGLVYLVVRLDPDGAGMTRVELMRPGAELQPRPEWNQWR